jgi:hypothetical protein
VSNGKKKEAWGNVVNAVIHRPHIGRIEEKMGRHETRNERVHLP